MGSAPGVDPLVEGEIRRRRCVAPIVVSIFFGVVVALPFAHFVGTVGFFGAVVAFVKIVAGSFLAVGGLLVPGFFSRWDKTLTTVGRLLPKYARQDYVDEWQAWLLDLRSAGASRYQRLIEGLSIVFVAAPCLAVRLRTARQGTGE